PEDDLQCAFYIPFQKQLEINGKDMRKNCNFQIWRDFTSKFGGISLPNLAEFYFRIRFAFVKS
ncbi:MAG: hypothetical protein IJR34_00620, partial [Bacteroidales bacterium]|nr:hypothetical protein [Bacteroidales bacterium]